MTMKLEDALREYKFGSAGQFRAIAKDLGYSEEYNRGELRFTKGAEVVKLKLDEIRENTAPDRNAMDMSKESLCRFFDKGRADSPEYLRQLLSEKNISVVKHEGGRDGFTVIDHDMKMSYTGKSLYDYAAARGYELDGRGSRLEPGVMSDMRTVNGRDAKIRLSENGVNIYYRKEALVIPDTVLGRKLSREDKEDLLKGNIVLLGGKKDLYLQVDRELNSVVVRTDREISIPDTIGRTNGYPGYELTKADKYLLANGHSLDNKLIGTKEGYIIADVSLTADKKGIQFANIQEISNEQAMLMTKGKPLSVAEGKESGVGGRQQGEAAEEQAQSRNRTETGEERKAEQTKHQERDLEREMKDAVSRGDFPKLMSLYNEGYKPSAAAIKDIMEDKNVPDNTKIAVSKIFHLEENKNKGPLADVKLAKSGNDRSQGLGEDKVKSVAGVVNKMFQDM